MKKKRFYNDKKRNRKWTEEETGRVIYFADKYDKSAGDNTDLNINRRQKRKQAFTKEKNILRAKKLGVVICCFLIVSVGYTIMDVHMSRRSMSDVKSDNAVDSGISNIKISAHSVSVDSMTLDGAVMLDAVIDDTIKGGYTSVAFDLKREDGTIAYRSSLATIDAVGAISSPASDLKASTAKLQSNDILPVGVICCYRDNLMPLNDGALAVKSGGSGVFKDEKGNTYLDPSNENAYIYIRGIVEETAGAGISVFALRGCDVPKESGAQGGGYDTLVKKLQKDLGTDIKFLNEKDVTIKTKDSDEIKAAVEKLKKDSNVIYNIECNSDNKKMIQSACDSRGVSSYITTMG